MLRLDAAHVRLRRWVLAGAIGLLAWSCGAALAVQTPTPTAAPPLLVGAQPRLPITPAFTHFSDPSGQWRPDQPGAAERARFDPLPAAWSGANLGLRQVDLWLRADVKLLAADAQRRFWVVQSAHLEQIDLVVQTPGQPTQWFQGGVARPVSQRPIPHRLQVFPIDLVPGVEQSIYMRVRSSGYVQFPVELWQADALWHHDLASYSMLSLYMGLLLGLLLYNLLLGLGARESVYLHYVAVVAFVGLWQLGASGLGAQYIWVGGGSLTHYLQTAPVGFAGAASLLFARRFLATADHAPTLDRCVKVVLLAWSAELLLLLWPGIWMARLALPALGWVTLVMLVVMAAHGLRAGLAGARYFCLAWAALIAGTAVLLMHRIGWLAHHTAIELAPMVGSALEMVLLSFALADRLRKAHRDRELAQAGLIKADTERAMALQATREKSRFLASVSHDLRQPLYALTLGIEAIRRQPARAAADHVLARMDVALGSAARLLDSIMTVARLETGTLSVRTDTFMLQPMLDRIDQIYGQQAQAKGLRWGVSPTLARGHTDEALLERMLSNLVANAVSNTESGGVLVTCRARGTATLVQVWDTGPGVPVADPAQLFDRHFRGQAETETESGVGLGLLIVRQSATLLGVTLELRSQVGRGSCFSLRVPGP